MNTWLTHKTFYLFKFAFLDIGMKQFYKVHILLIC